ncbi:MAG: glycerol-3-phosphate 1-O-acyltransferase PlsY [Acidimicrobiia bacterium]
MSSEIVIPLSILVAYLLGSVSFGILVAKSQGVDIRSEGSGNPGVSNVLRVLGYRSGAAVLVGDGVKGAAAAWIGAALWSPEFGYVTLLAAVVGHAFPIWHGLKGGKSVATAIGGFMYLAPAVGLALGVLWLGIVVVWKRASVASLVVMTLVVPALWFIDRTNAELAWAAAIAVFVLVRHASNIKRLLSSSEQLVTR